MSAKGHSALELRWSEAAINQASKNGHVAVLEWRKYSGLEMQWTEAAINMASKYGRIEVLEWWKHRGLEPRWGADAIDLASQYGQIDVLVEAEWDRAALQRECDGHWRARMRRSRVWTGGWRAGWRCGGGPMLNILAGLTFGMRVDLWVFDRVCKIETETIRDPLVFWLVRVLLGDFIKGAKWRVGWVYKLKYKPFLEAQDDVFAIVNPFSTEVFIADADIVRQIALAKVTEFPKPTQNYRALEIFGPNILTLELDEWKRHRRVAAPQFSEQLNGQVFDASAKTTKELFEIWGDETEVDLGRMLYQVTLCILGEAAFGVPFELGQQEQVLEGFTMSLQQCVRFVLANTLLIVAIPRWIKMLPFGFTRKFFVAVDEFRKHLEMIIKGPVDANSKSGTLLRLLVKAVNEEEDPQRQLSDLELVSSAFIFLVAGHDTTANMLTYVLGMLAVNPEYQETLLEETRKVLQDDEELMYKHYSDLRFAQAIINETLRLFPTVPFRECVMLACRPVNTCELCHFSMLNGQYRIPSDSTTQDPYLKNTVIWMNPIALHYNTKYWGDDAETFRPERFLSINVDGGVAEKMGDSTPKFHKYAFLPFNVGPRACIGRKFALVEMAVILTLLNREYTWKPAPSMGAGLDGEDAAIRGCRQELNRGAFFIAMKPTNPIKLVFSRRE
ncbi:cytochrome P450 [Cladochytrium replicatum]|nr:cytochrome P450 [Cladochytrium replicatum]